MKANIFFKIKQHKVLIILIIIIVFMVLIYQNPIIVIEALAEDKLDGKSLNVEEIMKEINELKEKHELMLQEIVFYRKQLVALYNFLNSYCYAVFISVIVASVISVLIFRVRT